MATPTERLTARTQQLLGEDVVLAMRVRRGPPDRLAKLLAQVDGINVAALSPLLMTILAPLAWLIRLGGAALSRSNEQTYGVLAILPNDERVLLRSSKFRPSRPLEAIHRFPEATPLVPDVDLMQALMVAQLTLDGQVFIVNGVDFVQLLKMVENGTIPSVAIRSKLPELQNTISRWGTQEPEDFLID